MKTKLYTKGHDTELFKSIGNSDKQFTAQEHAYVRKVGLSEHFQSKEALLRYYLSESYYKLEVLSFLIKHIRKNNFHNCLSLGAGPCVFEYLLRCSLPIESNVVAIDFDPFLIDRAKEFFPEITAREFDFFKDDVVTFAKSFKFNFDVAFFIVSACIMDDEDFIRIFRGLKESGIKQIIDVHGGYMDHKAVIKNIIKRAHTRVGKIFTKRPVEQWSGKFLGFSRNRAELRRLYKESGFKIEKEFSLSGFKYVAILSW